MNPALHLGLRGLAHDAHLALDVGTAELTRELLPLAGALIAAIATLPPADPDLTWAAGLPEEEAQALVGRALARSVETAVAPHLTALAGRTRTGLADLASASLPSADAIDLLAAQAVAMPPARTARARIEGARAALAAQVAPDPAMEIAFAVELGLPELRAQLLHSRVLLPSARMEAARAGWARPPERLAPDLARVIRAAALPLADAFDLALDAARSAS